jgi:hypothetical protein
LFFGAACWIRTSDFRLFGPAQFAIVCCDKPLGKSLIRLSDAGVESDNKFKSEPGSSLSALPKLGFLRVIFCPQKKTKRLFQAA